MLVPRKLIISGIAVVFAIGGGGVAAASSLQKDVTLVVDGQTLQVNGYIGTVGDALAKGAVSLEQKDVVQPAADSQLKDGETITVTRIRAKQVTVTHDGTTTMVSSYASTVAGALYDAGVSVNESDRVTPEITDQLTSGQLVSVQRVVTATIQTTDPIAYASTTVKSATLAKGTTTVTTKGVAGVKTSTFRVVTVDGVEESRTLVTQTETPATNQVTAVGTKVVTTTTTTSANTGSTAGLNLANAAMWDRVAQCESSGNWHINTGNGYYGGLQFLTSTWLAWGGGQYAPRADLASREQQITIANKLYAASGLASWGCKG